MQDQAWKEIIEKLFPDFLAFFFPQISKDIDFSWGFELSFQFPIIKLLDYKERWDELVQNPNPFSIVVLSFLKTIEIKGSEQQRYSWKKKFLLELYERGLTRDIIFILYQFIDLIMNLSEELEIELTEELVKIEEDRKMSIVTSAERKGRIDGLHESIYDIFEIKFGKNVYELFAQVKQIQNVEILQKI